MSTRTALSFNTELRFGPDTYFFIRDEIGRGGSCIVYDAVYQTNAGDEKIVRIRECYPCDLPLRRDPPGALTCPDSAAAEFGIAKKQMYADFRLCNRLFYAETSSDAIINTINVYEANNTVYVVSDWARENVLSSMKPESLRDCLAIVRQTACALRSIHRAGYLYLDIKPDNISVVKGSSGRVRLFDFDTLFPIDFLKDGHNLRNQRLSYTRGFAALELRKGQLSGLGPHTDVYGIGALLFYLLFGHTAEAPDCARDAVYDFSGIIYNGPYPDRLLILLTEFFHKTLAGLSIDRCPDMDPVIAILSEIERLADPVYPYLYTTPLNAPAFFIGRSAETESLAKWIGDETQQILFITGMGGIGKSTFIRHFLADNQKKWDSICFLFFNKSLRQTITDDSRLRINGMTRFPEEKENDYFERKLQKLREIMERDRVLLVFDNFEDHHDPDIGQILALNCRVIFITRTPLGSLNIPVLALGALNNEEYLWELFLHYLDRPAEAGEPELIREIIFLLDGHTLALELLARQISNSFLTLAQAYDLLKKQGALHFGSERVDYLRDDRIIYERLEAIFTQLFEVNDLSEEQIAILKAVTLFPAPGIDVHEFMRLAAVDSLELLISLVRYGWITSEKTMTKRRNSRPFNLGQAGERSADNPEAAAGSFIFLHPLIRDVIRDLPGTEPALAKTKNVLRTLYNDIIFESHKEEINIGNSDNIPPELRNIDKFETNSKIGGI